MLFRKYEIDIFNYYIFKNVISILEVGSLFSFLPMDNSLLLFIMICSVFIVYQKDVRPINQAIPDRALRFNA